MKLIQYNTFPADKVTAFTTTIDGGCSSGNYTSFNLGEYCNDEETNVIGNRKELAAKLNLASDNIFVPYQTHEDRILIIDDNFINASAEEKSKLLKSIDALVTGKENICIGITTADCVPVLLYDPKNNILATIHAGWKSTVARIVEKTIRVMSKTFLSHSEDLLAIIGPSICPVCFEVGDEVGERFERARYQLSDIATRHPQTNKLHIDLKEANRQQLVANNIQSDNIEISPLCTMQEPGLFFSARRQGYNSGRMLSGGVLHTMKK